VIVRHYPGRGLRKIYRETYPRGAPYARWWHQHCRENADDRRGVGRGAGWRRGDGDVRGSSPGAPPAADITRRQNAELGWLNRPSPSASWGNGATKGRAGRSGARSTRWLEICSRGLLCDPDPARRRSQDGAFAARRLLAYRDWIAEAVLLTGMRFTVECRPTRRPPQGITTRGVSDLRGPSEATGRRFASRYERSRQRRRTSGNTHTP